MSNCVLFISYQKKVLLYDNLVQTPYFPSYFVCYKINISMISYIFCSFAEDFIIYQLGKLFFQNHFFAFFLSFVFISMYDFSQAFLLNLVTLCTFLNSVCTVCFKFLIYITYSFLWCKFATSFSTFLHSFREKC